MIPNLCPIFCWNHNQQDIKQWVRSHNGTSDDITVYVNDVMELLKSEKENIFEQQYAEVSLKWSRSFVQYFEGQKNNLKSCAARYQIEPWKLYNPTSGGHK